MAMKAIGITVVLFMRQSPFLFVEEERRVLKEQLHTVTVGKKLAFTVEQRRRLAEAAKHPTPDALSAPVGCRSRLGGMLNYYHREAA
jgi:hypothetical protein